MHWSNFDATPAAFRAEINQLILTTTMGEVNPRGEVSMFTARMDSLLHSSSALSGKDYLTGGLGGIRFGPGLPGRS
jgi:hypothetical protein